jgi:hypothetical protein
MDGQTVAFGPSHLRDRITPSVLAPVDICGNVDDVTTPRVDQPLLFSFKGVKRVEVLRSGSAQPDTLQGHGPTRFGLEYLRHQRLDVPALAEGSCRQLRRVAGQRDREGEPDAIPGRSGRPARDRELGDRFRGGARLRILAVLAGRALSRAGSSIAHPSSGPWNASGAASWTARQG